MKRINQSTQQYNRYLQQRQGGIHVTQQRRKQLRQRYPQLLPQQPYEEPQRKGFNLFDWLFK